MKVGHIINCDDEDDLRDALRELGEAGYGAVRMDLPNSYFIEITSEPEEAAETDNAWNELEMLEKKIEATREWNRKAARGSWIAIIAASISLIVSILRI